MVMAPPLVTGKDIAHMGKDGVKSENEAAKAPTIYSVGQRVRISKRYFAKGFENKWTQPVV